jgi:Fe-S oxidoreductase
VKRLQGDSHEKKDALLVLGFIFIIVSSLLLQNAALYQINPREAHAFRPIASIIASIFTLGSALQWSGILWWVHICTILIFANYLPFSKHFHVYTSVPNVFFSSIDPVNTLAPIDFEEEGVEKFGVVDIDDLTWKNLFDGFTCTHCGRCSEVCPANSTGKLLSPREVIVQIRERTFDFAPILLKQMNAPKPAEGEEAPALVLTEAEQAICEKKFVGDYESVDALWQCTTCGACMQECPVMNEHVPAIVGMRRSLVMMDSNFPPLLQSAFSNLETNGTPWAFSPSERADWAQGTGVKTAADNPDFDIVFWVGCAGSFDDRAKKISVAFATLLQKAGVNFAILGTEEQCNGDVARRLGQEYLADMLIKANIETMNRYNVKKIVTFCPHCFNTMKNEYPSFGGNYEVVHHTEYLNELISEGKLKLKADNSEKHTFTYHDSCYLGRYNNLYDEPRKIIASLPNVELAEVERNCDKAFCCGAGGGQMFLEETEGKRINVERTDELLATGADTIALNCPFCMTMVTDGVKANEKTDEVKVRDLAEILLDYVD